VAQLFSLGVRAARHNIFSTINGHKRKTRPMRTGSIARVIAAFTLCVIGILGSLHLKRSGDISEASFIFLESLSVFVGIVIFLSDRITHFSVTKLEVTLEKMKETETSVRELGRAILAMEEASSHSLMLESFDPKAYNESVEKLRGLVLEGIGPQVSWDYKQNKPRKP
jgi:hypothetical protein